MEIHSKSNMELVFLQCYCNKLCITWTFQGRQNSFCTGVFLPESTLGGVHCRGGGQSPAKSRVKNEPLHGFTGWIMTRHKRGGPFENHSAWPLDCQHAHMTLSQTVSLRYWGGWRGHKLDAKRISNWVVCQIKLIKIYQIRQDKI